MKRMILMAPMLAPMLTAACATMAPPPPERGLCVVDEAAKMHFAAVKYRERMRGEIEHATHSAVSRIVRPGDMVTQDLRPDRLTILLDDGGLISGLRCG